jgi:hypothetical protein
MKSDLPLALRDPRYVFDAVLIGIPGMVDIGQQRIILTLVHLEIVPALRAPTT